MIQRHQRIVFWCLVACIVGMAALLFAERTRARDRVSQLADNTPIDSPYTTTEPITLDMANDDEGTIVAEQRQIALPSELTARARALLDHLAAEYARPGSQHPLNPGAMVDDVFFVPLPVVGYTVDTTQRAGADGRVPTTLAAPDANALKPQSPGDEIAIINLRGAFVNAHPSGVEVEQLTLLSILGTLHANLPQVEQVRFLVDGQPRETLAGHADLLRTYPVRDTTTTPAAH